jgi:hypothetical protein
MVMFARPAFDRTKLEVIVGEVVFERTTPPKSTVRGLKVRNALLLTSVPVRLIGNWVLKPVTPFAVNRVRAVLLTPG